MSAVKLDPQTLAALDVARQMAAAGVPIFLGDRDPAGKGHNGTGFWLPAAWQHTTPDPAVVDRWQPGMALCAVMGCGLDLTDFDPRNGGDPAQLNGTAPRAYGVATTPSGGLHWFIRSLGVGSLDGIAPGIDIKGGLPDGSSRGFAFLAPTVRASKVTGEPTSYRWVQAPAGWREAVADDSGAALAARIRESRGAGAARPAGGPDWWQEFLANREPQSVPAAARAIERKCAEVAEWAPDSGIGFRQTLMRAAMTLGGYVGGGFLDESNARERLESGVSTVWGAPNAEDQLWIQQGLNDGMAQPFVVLTPEQERAHSAAAQAVAAEGEDEQPPPPEPPWTVFTELRGEFDPAGDATDQGLAKAVAYRMYPVLRYAKDARLWVKRERDVWEECSDDMTDWVISVMAELMPLGETPVPKKTEERTEGHWQAARRALFMSSAGTGKVGRKVRAIVRSDHPATLRVADLDANPDVLWAGAVAWDLRKSGEVPTPAYWVDRNTPHLRTALCAPNPTVPTPRWDAFTAAVLPDPEVRAWAMRVLAISFTGHADAALPVLYGRERSGKTSMIEMLMQVLGSYGWSASPKLLNANDNSHDSILYDLKGRRLAFIDEGPRKGYEDTERLKQLTGGAPITAGAKYAHAVLFSPSHTLVMTTNTEPQLTDPALRARVRLIPCDSLEELVRPVRVALLGSGLREEAPGILAAMMRESAGYLLDRDSAATAAAPESIRGLALEVAEGQDPIREWVESCTVPSEPGTPGRELHHQYFARWFRDHPLYSRRTVPNETTFGRTLTEMGYPARKVHRLAYRPLSVLNGPGMPMQPVTPAEFMAGERVGRGLGEGWERVSAPTLSPDNPGSGGVSEHEGEGREGFPYQKDGRKKEEVKVKSRGEGREIASQPSQPSPELPLTRENGERGLVSDPLQTLSKPSPNPLPASPDPLPPPPDPSDDHENRASSQVNPGFPAAQGPDQEKPASSQVNRRFRLTPEEKAARAEERRLAKAAEHETARLVAVRDASGEMIGLPAVVDRTGAVLGLSVDQAAAVVHAAISRSGGLTVDVETTGYPIGHELYALRSVQLGDATAAVVLDPIAHAALITGLLAAAPVLRAFSASADLVPLAVAGLIDAESGWARMEDTVIVAKLADPAITGTADGLKPTARAVLGDRATAPAADTARAELFKAGRWLTDTKVDTPIERSGWAQVATGCTTMLRYAASDVLDTDALAAALPVPPPAVLARERLAQVMTARVTHRGLAIDAEHVAELTAVHTAARAAAHALVTPFGVDNPGSNVQVAEKAAQLGAALPLTATGRPSVAEGALQPLRAAEGRLGAFVAAVLDYRHHDTVLGTFLGPYRTLCERGDGRARPAIYTLGTNTGRMSAVRPNCQQLPRSGGVRACITADPGHVLISADFSGVEIRVAAALSQDPTLMAILRDGRDLHGEIARLVWGPAATKAHRYKAKPMVFGRLYGSGVAGMARQNGVSEAVAQSVVDALGTLTPKLSEWSRSVSNAVEGGRKTHTSHSGRVIHLPTDRPHAAANFAIQGSARELLVDSLVRWSQTRWGTCTLLPIHDELLVAVPEADAEEATAELVRCMTSELFGVSIVAEASTPSFAWADAT